MINETTELDNDLNSYRNYLISDLIHHVCDNHTKIVVSSWSHHNVVMGIFADEEPFRVIKKDLDAWFDFLLYKARLEYGN